MSETLRNSIDRLLIERVSLVSILQNIEADLRAIKHAQQSAPSDKFSEAMNRHHRRALASYSRAQARLREVNHAIKAGNIQWQIEITREARGVKKASKAQAKSSLLVFDISDEEKARRGFV